MFRGDDQDSISLSEFVSDIDLLLGHPRTTSHTQPKDHHPIEFNLMEAPHACIRSLPPQFCEAVAA